MRATDTSIKRFPLKRIITVCEKKDIATWKVSSGAIISNIAADSYLLICPDSQIDDFSQITHPAWDIVGELRFSKNCAVSEIRKLVCGENTQRIHWLLQQFLKINAIVSSDLDDQDAVLIWDADTVPLRTLEFIDRASGKLLYYHGSENHTPYFATIEKLFGFGKTFEGSFIAQNLPLRVGWIRNIVAEIEQNASQPYEHAILATLPGLSGSEFSEYETIGSWAYRNHREEMIIRKKNRWLRCGTELLGRDPSGLRVRTMLKLLARRFDYVAIENWQRDTSLKAVARALSRRISRVIKRS